MEEYISTQLARQQADTLAASQASKIAADAVKKQTEAEMRKLQIVKELQMLQNWHQTRRDEN